MYVPGGSNAFELRGRAHIERAFATWERLVVKMGVR